MLNYNFLRDHIPLHIHDYCCHKQKFTMTSVRLEIKINTAGQEKQYSVLTFKSSTAEIFT